MEANWRGHGGNAELIELCRPQDAVSSDILRLNELCGRRMSSVPIRPVEFEVTRWQYIDVRVISTTRNEGDSGANAMANN